MAFQDRRESLQGPQICPQQGPYNAIVRSGSPSWLQKKTSGPEGLDSSLSRLLSNPLGKKIYFLGFMETIRNPEAEKVKQYATEQTSYSCTWMVRVGDLFETQTLSKTFQLPSIRF